METRKSLLKVVVISEIKEDKNGKKYQVITVQNPMFKTEVDENTGEVTTILQKALKATTTAYHESYLDGAPEWLVNATVGVMIEGRVERRAVPQYEFTGRDGQPVISNTYPCVVFGDTTQDNYEEIVKATFRRNGHQMIGDTFIVLVKEKAVEPTVEPKRVDLTGAKSKEPKAILTVDQF